LNLNEETITQAVQAGFMQWASCTANHPPSFPGISAWSETVRVFRDLTVSRGWVRSNEANLPFTTNAEGTVAVAVATGDESTGNPDFTPCTKSSKGPRTRKAVAVNNRQLSLFPIEVTPEELAQLQGEGRRMTWLLLFNRDEVRREVRFELSRPTKINKDGKVDGWIERILFRPFPFDSDVIEVPRIESPNDGVINIEIKRKA
jgi:hypothetical protein